MTKLDLITDYLPACQMHSETSRAAAHAIKPSAKALREQVFDFVKGRGERGATDEEIASCLKMSGNTERPRRRELVLAGRVIDSGKKRETESGLMATIWITPSPPSPTLPQN